MLQFSSAVPIHELPLLMLVSDYETQWNTVWWLLSLSVVILASSVSTWSFHTQIICGIYIFLIYLLLVLPEKKNQAITTTENLVFLVPIIMVLNSVHGCHNYTALLQLHYLFTYYVTYASSRQSHFFKWGRQNHSLSLIFWHFNLE